MNVLGKSCLVGLLFIQVGCAPPRVLNDGSSREDEKVAPMTTIPTDDVYDGNDPLSPGERQILNAIMGGDLPLVKSLFEKYPEAILRSKDSENWVGVAVSFRKPEILKWLLDQGLDINWRPEKDETTPLVLAIHRCGRYRDPETFATVGYLLSRGANPNLGRPLIAALNCKNETAKMPLLKLLVEHGADVNRLYDIYGDVSNQFSALDLASGEYANYLRSLGAKTAVDLLGNALPQPNREQ